MITITASGGFLQQKANISYQYSFSKMSTVIDKNKSRQLFFGFEVGSTRLQNKVYTYFNQGSFEMHANGAHLSLLGTKVIRKSLKRKKEKFSYTSTTLKISYNYFNKVKSYPWYDTYDEDDDFNPPDKAWITNAKTKAVDFELHFSKHIRLNSHNFLNLAMYTGIRIGSTSGTEHRLRYDWDYPIPTKKWFKSEKNYSYNLNPFILGVSLGYQINFGSKK